MKTKNQKPNAEIREGGDTISIVRPYGMGRNFKNNAGSDIRIRKYIKRLGLVFSAADVAKFPWIFTKVAA